MNPVQLLKEIVGIPSPSGKEESLSGYLIEQMNALGIKAYPDEAGNAVGVIGSGSRKILLVGHMDTVPGNIPVKVRGDLLFGRGAVDAKGPLAAFISAAASIKDKIESSEWSVVIIGAVEEECPTSRGARHLLAGHRPDYVVIGEPSSWQGITIGYKGRLMARYSHEQQMSHTASRSENPAETALDYFCRLRELCTDYNKGRSLFHRLDINLQSIKSLEDPFLQGIDMTIGFRIPAGYGIDELKKAAAGPRVRFYGEEQPILAGRNNALVRALIGSIRKHGGKAAFKVKTGTSDMNIIGNHYGVPIVAYGPGDSSQDHTPGEHISLEEYKKSIIILREALLTLIPPTLIP
ncbi:MAG: [LysW]-lysine hydrolase [archaeon]